MNNIRDISGILALVLILFAVTFMIVQDAKEKDVLKDMSNQQVSSFCSGVFDYGAKHGSADMRYSFKKATKWFAERAEKFGGMNQQEFTRAQTVLDKLAQDKNDAQFKQYGIQCADIVLDERSAK